MLTLKGQHIFLRALESGDLDFLYELENDTSLWEVSGTTTPFSKDVLKLYLENSHRDIYDVKQLRLCICDAKNNEIGGLIDVFDFDPKNKRAGVGIVVYKSSLRNQGVASEAIAILSDYVAQQLDLKQLYANVAEDNEVSVHLFEKLGFERVGVKKDWLFFNGVYKNEILFQKILS